MKYQLVTIDLPKADRARIFGDNPQPWQQPHSCRAMVLGHGWKVHDNHADALAQAVRFNREVLRGVESEVWMIVLAGDTPPVYGDSIDFPPLPHLTPEPFAPFGESQIGEWYSACHS